MDACRVPRRRDFAFRASLVLVLLAAWCSVPASAQGMQIVNAGYQPVGVCRTPKDCPCKYYSALFSDDSGLRGSGDYKTEARAQEAVKRAVRSHVWQHGSVVRSWLNELAVRAFEKDRRLDKLKGFVADSGEGRWTVAEAIEEDVPAPVITLSLIMRLRSRQEDSFGGKVIAALRNEFGGHAVKGT